MKKQLLHLGKGLSKTEQKEINGGGGMPQCSYENAPSDCGYGFWCPDTTRICTPCDTSSAGEYGCNF